MPGSAAAASIGRNSSSCEQDSLATWEQSVVVLSAPSEVCTDDMLFYGCSLLQPRCISIQATKASAWQWARAAARVST